MMSPVGHPIDQNEFLLVTGSSQGFGIGVFISASGEPVRGTLQWPSIPIAVVFQAPYIVALLKNSIIHIHDLQSQLLVQEIPLPTSSSPKFMKLASFPLELSTPSNGLSNDSSGIAQILVGSSTALYALVMIPLKSQLAQLFEHNHIPQALNLLTKMHENGESHSTVYLINLINKI